MVELGLYDIKRILDYHVQKINFKIKDLRLGIKLEYGFRVLAPFGKKKGLS